MTETQTNRGQQFCAALLLSGTGIFLNGCTGGSHSQNAEATVAQAPAIVKQPTDLTVYIGDTASFTVTTTGTAPLLYDWRRNGISLPGANLVTYTTTALTGKDDGATYTVVISNAAGSIVSSAAKLSVNPRPVQMTAAPLASSVAEGQDAAFSVTETGTVLIAHHWLLNGNNEARANFFASMMTRMARDYGGLTFIKALWKDALQRSAATTTRGTIDNFIFAANAAVSHHFTLLFQDT